MFVLIATQCLTNHNLITPFCWRDSKRIFQEVENRSSAGVMVGRIILYSQWGRFIWLIINSSAWASHDSQYEAGTHRSHLHDSSIQDACSSCIRLWIIPSIPRETVSSGRQLSLKIVQWSSLTLFQKPALRPLL